MDTTLVCIILFCVWGCGLQCYHIGRNSGISDAVQHMSDEGLIDLDE